MGEFNSSIRSHWAIENNLHWNLDVIFKEDYQEKCTQTAIENSNLIEKFAITMLDQEIIFSKSKNSLRPQLSLHGNTPSEVFLGKPLDINHYKPHFGSQKILRVTQNRQNRCTECK